MTGASRYFVAEDFRRGQRVTVTIAGKDELATVVYVVMRGPDYSRVQGVSVEIDSKRGSPGYTGTMVPVESVKL